MDLIRIKNLNGRLVTTSLNVAHVFRKEPYNVVRDIENLDCSPEFRELNFEVSYYTSDSGQLRKYKKYVMTRDGFMFLVMGYTGKAAAKLKEAYISQFNAMEKELQNRYLPQTKLQALEQLVESERRNIQLNKQIEEIKPKAEFTDHVAASDTDMTVGRVANILAKKGLKIGRNRLFAMLKDKSGLNLLIDTYTPTQYALENGWLVVDPYIQKDENGHEHLRFQVKVTGKGLIYIERNVRALFDRQQLTASSRKDFFDKFGSDSDFAKKSAL